jgi:uncharacterized membrane protein
VKEQRVTNSARVPWGIVLGFAIGGFFDGILLHQILQWHHLLSLVPAVDSLRLQVLWDGYFHALMYVIALLGLLGLWRNRAAPGQPTGVALFGAALIGFGVWHVLDGVFSHWLLGIHRIKLDSPQPLLWDLVWFTFFGIGSLFAGLAVWRRNRAEGGPNGSTRALALLGLVTIGAAIWSAQPPAGQRFTTVVFSPTVTPAEAINAVVAEGGSLVWTDPAVSVLVVDVPESRRSNFYRRGAMLVSGSGSPGGCFNWSVA